MRVLYRWLRAPNAIGWLLVTVAFHSWCCDGNSVSSKVEHGALGFKGNHRPSKIRAFEQSDQVEEPLKQAAHQPQYSMPAPRAKDIGEHGSVISAENPVVNNQQSIDNDGPSGRDSRATLYSSIRSLRQQKHELDDELEQVQGQYDESIRQKEFAELRRQATHDARDLESELRRESEAKLMGVRRELPMFRKSMNDLQMQALMKGNDIRSLIDQQTRLAGQKAQLVRALHRQGFGHWAESVLRHKANAYVSDAIVEGSQYVVEPVVDGIEKAAKMEGELTSRINRHVPIEASQFYAGLVAVIVSLFPIVVITRIAMKIKRKLSQLTLRHIALLGSIYFAVLATGCWIAAGVAQIDVILTLQRRSQALYDFTVMMQGLLYVAYCIVHIATSISTADRKSFTHSAVVSVIGLHFFCHATAHLRRGEHPHVDRLAYFMYSLGFISTIRQLILSARRPKCEKRPLKSLVKLGAPTSTFQEESRSSVDQSGIQGVCALGHQQGNAGGAPDASV